MATSEDPDIGFAQTLITCPCSNKAELFCINCKVSLCRTCVGEHMLSLPSQRHDVVKYSLKLGTPLQPCCDKHNDQRCVHYCQNCDVPVCDKCIGSQTHNLHEFGDITEILKSKVDIILEEIQILNDEVTPRCHENIEELEKYVMKHQKIGDNETETGNLVELEVTENEDTINRRKLILQFQSLLDYAQKTIKKNTKLTQIMHWDNIAELKLQAGIAGAIKNRLGKLEKLGLEMKNFTNVFVKNLKNDVDEEELIEMFKPFGEISSAKVMRDKVSKRSHGYGFVDFEDPKAAEKAVSALHGKRIRGKALYAGRAKTKMQRKNELKELRHIDKEEKLRQQGVNLYVKNLDLNIDDARLRKEFEVFGNITSAKVMSEEGRSKGFGFVCFSSPEEATNAATKMNGRIIVAKPLYVALALSKEDRKAQLASQYMQRITSMRMQGQQMGQLSQMFQRGGAGNFVQTVPQDQSFHAPDNKHASEFHIKGTPKTKLQMPTAEFIPRQPALLHHGARGESETPNTVNPEQGSQITEGGTPNMSETVNHQKGYEGFNSAGLITKHYQTQNPGVKQAPPQAVIIQGQDPLTATMLATAPPQEQKQMLGERLFPLISGMFPDMAGKITGTLLEIDNSELLHMLECQECLEKRVKEALAVLQNHQATEKSTSAKPVK